MYITQEQVQQYQSYLYNQEKSPATIQKYIRDIQCFLRYLSHQSLSKERIIDYKQSLLINYKISSINSMLISINGFLKFIGLSTFKIKLLKVQKTVFIDKDKELTHKEYQRLLTAAKFIHNERLYILLQSICTTGIRVSEHRYITVESLKEGKATVYNKGKVREIIYPKALISVLKKYSKKHNIERGPIFITKTGKPLNRTNIWRDMKRLCYEANVDEKKVYPHNLRHLFAFTYYSIEKDLVRLADILGHSSIETTRIYTKTNGNEYERQFRRMKLMDISLQ